MNLFSRIAIGTANFGREYNGAKVSEKDIVKILGYCQCSGIDTLDCATAYGWEFMTANSYFNIVTKIRSGEELGYDEVDKLYGCLVHNYHDKNLTLPYLKALHSNQFLIGASMYSPEEQSGYNLSDLDIIQVPYSLYDRRFERLFRSWKSFDIEIHVRSIFLRGKIIKDGIPAEECIKFCLCNPYIDKVIIGLDSFEQLQRNLDFLHKWKNLEKHDKIKDLYNGK